MKKNICIVLLVYLVVVIESCVTPINLDLKQNDSQPILVVEGQITDKPGPFQVKLTQTVALNSDKNSTPVLFAQVRIIDNQGKEFRLYGDENGLYSSSEKDLRGIPGNTYTLYVKTSDDEEYFSSPVQMQEAPEIDSLYFEEVEHNLLNAAGQPIKESWINILVDSHDPEGKTRFWKFDFLETWEVNLYGDQVKVQRDPFNTENFYLTHIKDSLPPKICWVTQPSNEILITTSSNNSKNEVKRFTINSLGPGGNRLRIRYSILVRQYSLSQELYNYLKLLKNVNENTGGLYSTLPIPVFGNIFSSNENKKALGYFSASSVKEKRLFIQNSDHHVNTVSVNNGCIYYDFILNDQIVFFGPSVTGSKIYSLPGDCNDCDSYGTKVKPSYW